MALEEAVGCGRRGGGPGAPARPLKGTAASLGAGGCRLAPGPPVRLYFIPRRWGCRGEPLPACCPVPVFSSVSKPTTVSPRALWGCGQGGRGWSVRVTAEPGTKLLMPASMW